MTMRERSNPTYPVGSEILAYENLRPIEETCSHGSKHIVNRYKRLKLIVTETRREFIKGLFYDEDGYGFRYFAFDQFGDLWESVDYWDGAANWGISVEGKSERFTTRHPTLPCYLNGELKTSIRYDRELRGQGVDGSYVYE